MKELGFLFSPLPYNNLMSLYTNLGQHEKVPSVMAEMKSNGIIPDQFSYRICINSYGVKADFFGLENTLEEMECELQIIVDWNTYAVVANNYNKGNLRDKAYSALQKAESKIDKKRIWIAITICFPCTAGGQIRGQEAVGAPNVELQEAY